MVTAALSKIADPAVAAAIEREEGRQRHSIE